MNAKQKKKMIEIAQRRKAFQANKVVSARFVAGKDLNIHREVEYIVARAQAGDARCVGFRTLVLFSTQSGDAWLLEPKDGLALMLARAGEALPVQLIDTETQFGIGWDKSFEIKGDSFITLDHDNGRKTVTEGYPTSALMEFILSMLR